MSMNYYGDDCFLYELDNIEKLTGYFTANGEYDIKIPVLSNNLNLKYNTDTLELESIIIVSLRKPNLPILNLGDETPKRQYGTAYCKGLQKDLISGEIFLVFSSYKDDTDDYNIFVLNLPNDNKNIPQTNTEISAVNFIPQFVNQDPRVYFNLQGENGANGGFLNTINNFNVNFVDDTSTTSYDGSTLTLNIKRGEDGATGNHFNTSESIFYINTSLTRVPLPQLVYTQQITDITGNILYDNNYYQAYTTDVNDNKFNLIKQYTQASNISFRGIVNLNMTFENDRVGSKTDAINSLNEGNVFISVYLLQNNPITLNEQYLPLISTVNGIFINPEYTHEFVYNTQDRLDPSTGRTISDFPITNAKVQVKVWLQIPKDFYKGGEYPSVSIDFELLEIKN